jgi:hypothetical protein
LDNKTLDHTYDQGYDDNAIANHSNNVDLVSLFCGLSHYSIDSFSNQDSYNIHNTPFDIEQTNGSFRGPLNTPFVDAFHKSCAIQHLAAETADSASPLDLQSAARVDTNGMSPSSFFFDQVSICHQPFLFWHLSSSIFQSTMKLLAQYFGIDDEPQLPVNDVQLTQGLECIDPLLLNVSRNLVPLSSMYTHFALLSQPSMHCVQHNQDQEHVDHMLMNPEHLVEQGKSDVRMMVPDICNKDPNRHESHRRGLLGQW